jgi:hypothetical protein
MNTRLCLVHCIDRESNPELRQFLQWEASMLPLHHQCGKMELLELIDSIVNGSYAANGKTTAGWSWVQESGHSRCWIGNDPNAKCKLWARK